MLKELSQTRQVPGEPMRRWFVSHTMDLIVWYEDGTPSAFQLCYDKDNTQKALTWRSGTGFSHTGVDDGESNGAWAYKESPILSGNGSFDAARLVRLFREDAQQVPPDVRDFVTGHLQACLDRAAASTH